MNGSADAIIQALQRRMRLVAPHRRRPPGQFPPGWQEWFDTLEERRGAVRGVEPQELIAVLRARAPRLPPRAVAELGRWRAFATLWRQDWRPAPPDERPVRLLAGSVSLAWHLLLGAMLLWLIYQDFLVTAPPRGEEVVQVEFIGTGTPEEVGGGEDRQPAAEPVESATPVPAAPAAQQAAAALPPDPLPAATPAPEPELPEPALEPPPQPVEVTEPVAPVEEDYVLPPPTRDPQAPAFAMPELTMPDVQVPELAVPAPLPAPALEIARPSIEPSVALPERELVMREIPDAVALPAAPEAVLQRPEPVPPQLQARTREARQREVPMPTLAPAPAPAEPQPPVADAVAEAGEPEPAPAAPMPAASAGPEPLPAAGAWPDPAQADDWGAAEQELAGAQRGEPPGLFNSDGSVRLAEPGGSASPGQPPGTITEEIADLDRAGTWLRRPPTDYEPSEFDKYWRPNETLLEEWVRRSVSTIRIPIPGTTKTLVCQTVLLALGGGCGIDDPNLNEQPAGARPPPDIPFKPELQEGT